MLRASRPGAAAKAELFADVRPTHIICKPEGAGALAQIGLRTQAPPTTHSGIRPEAVRALDTSGSRDKSEVAFLSGSQRS